MPQLQLVELSIPLVVYCSGLAKAEVIDDEVHYIFYQLQRDGAHEDARVVRAVNLHIIMSAMNSLIGMQLAADALGMVIRGRARMDA